jgi:hypothetical protein
LVLELTPTRRWAIEIKRSTADPKPSRGFHVACEDLNVERRIVAYPGTHAFGQAGGIETLPVAALMTELLGVS